MVVLKSYSPETLVAVPKKDRLEDVKRFVEERSAAVARDALDWAKESKLNPLMFYV